MKYIAELFLPLIKISLLILILVRSEATVLLYILHDSGRLVVV